MTVANFPSALAFTLEEEGSWSDDPRDPGGATMDGITLTAWRAFTGDPDATADELRAIGVVQRTAFYGAEWNKVRGDDLPAGVDASVFDAYVNTGASAAYQLQRLVGLAGQARDGWIGAETIAAVAKADAAGLALRLCPGGIKVLQDGLGLLPDSKMGSVTLAAAKAHRDAVLVAALYDQHVIYYRACRLFPTYGAGWLARAKKRAEAGVRLAVPVGLRAPIS